MLFYPFIQTFLPGKISLLAHLFVCLLLMCFYIVTQIQQNVCPLENCRHGASDFRRFIEIVCFDQVCLLYHYDSVLHYSFGIYFNVCLIFSLNSQHLPRNCKNPISYCQEKSNKEKVQSGFQTFESKW